jgi:subtilisin family serine protease
MIRSPMNLLELVRLRELMERTAGSPAVQVGLIDGPVDLGHPDLHVERIHDISPRQNGQCARADSTACVHGTFVAGILGGRRGSAAPAICPGCTLLVHPLFAEKTSGNDQPAASHQELAGALLACARAGARVINLSLALLQSSPRGERLLHEALDFAMRQGALVVAAAGNQGAVGGSTLTRHPWVIPVIGCDGAGRPLDESNLGGSIGLRGLAAPGEEVTSLGTGGKSLTSGGTSAAAPFVTGAAALLWSAFPAAPATRIKRALTQSSPSRRGSVIPPLLDAAAALDFLRSSPS